jgi:hypothetical protein
MADGAATETADRAADGSAEGTDSGAVTLDADERELVLADLDALLPTLDGERRARFTRLRDAADAGQVPAELASALESVLELALQTGRARARYRADGEQVLTRLYGRTPAGRDLAAHLRRVNEALRALEGETIESVQVRMRTVGHFTLAVQTDATSITLVSRPDAIDVESISVGS